ncbi:hypothetical protein WJX84_003487 [Apatococcus fuscideae]|uniref:Uncharacterized protein n=1 Tax=Apatococcus fuscideae TaxID=2026836 RepID=A0AAW1T6E6_9CHLO
MADHHCRTTKKLSCSLALNREDEKQWRAEDLEQRVLDNARAIWSRFTERTRYEVNERAEQLRSIGNLSALVAGFAMTSFLQFTFSNNEAVKAVILGFGISTAFVVALSMNSMSMCGLIQASVFKMSHTFICEQEEEAFMIEAWDFAQSYQPGRQPPQPRRSFSKFWDMRCESEWRRAFYMFSTAVPIMLGNLTFASWIKFHDLQEVAIIMSAMLGVGILLFGVMQGHWFSYIAGPSANIKTRKMPVARQPAGLPFDWHLPPASPRKTPASSPMGNRCLVCQLQRQSSAREQHALVATEGLNGTLPFSVSVSSFLALILPSLHAVQSNAQAFCTSTAAGLEKNAVHSSLAMVSH